MTPAVIKRAKIHAPNLLISTFFFSALISEKKRLENNGALSMICLFASDWCFLFPNNGVIVLYIRQTE